MVTVFYAAGCPFSARLAPGVNALARIHPKLHVIDLDTGKSVVVRINDRGPSPGYQREDFYELLSSHSYYRSLRWLWSDRETPGRTRTRSPVQSRKHGKRRPRTGPSKKRVRFFSHGLLFSERVKKPADRFAVLSVFSQSEHKKDPCFDPPEVIGKNGSDLAEMPPSSVIGVIAEDPSHITSR